jgi:hypothetical protein
LATQEGWHLGHARLASLSTLVGLQQDARLRRRAGQAWGGGKGPSHPRCHARHEEKPHVPASRLFAPLLLSPALRAQGFKYVFRFGPNPYFEDRELFKQFKYNKDTGDLLVDQTAIKWKAGHNLCDPRQVGQLIAGKQVRAPSPPKTRMLCVQCPGHACTHVRIHARPLLPLRACHAVMAGSLGKRARAVALSVSSQRVKSTRQVGALASVM